jgi:hypothetical protein
MPPSKTPPLPLPDFERISQTILGILAAENANIAASCLFFGLIGKSILNRHYKLAAHAVVGTAAFNLGGPRLIAFANPVGEAVSVGQENFHCWVEVDGWFLDFSSLVFPEIIAARGSPPCPRLMFQKPLVKAALSIDELSVQGSFYRLPDEALTHKRFADFHRKTAYADLVEIATQWYRPPPERMPSITMRDKHWKPIPAVISTAKLIGVWS